MKTIEHLFLSAAGDLLPHWRQAFPAAACARLGSKRSLSNQPMTIWLRLRPGTTVAQQIAAVRQEFGDVAFVVLSDTPNDEEALAAFSTAARAYCNTHAGAEVLQKVAAVVVQGGIWIGEPLMQRLLAAPQYLPVATVAQEKDWTDALTEREQEVARTIVAGASNKEIARQLGITERTVKAHVGAILDKLQVRDRLQLALLIRDRQYA
ncbi:MAG: response regulator transcription factor [Nitrosomonadales bacterium]|nr:response regulator transcription factor [Nitrosomonadales bacterium]